MRAEECVTHAGHALAAVRIERLAAGADVMRTGAAGAVGFAGAALADVARAIPAHARPAVLAAEVAALDVGVAEAVAAHRATVLLEEVTHGRDASASQPTGGAVFTLNAQYVHEALTARHIEHEFFLGPGKHDFAFWSARVPRSLAFLRDHAAKPQ